MRKSAVISTWILSIFFIACGSNSSKQEATKNGGKPDKMPPAKVEGFIVKKVNFAQQIEVPGNIIANESVEIHPEVSGRIISLSVGEGNFVRKGTLLAKLYDADLQAQLRKLEVQLQLAQTTEERQSKLLKIQGISQQDYDLSLLQVNNLRADIGIIKTAIGKTEIRAPFDGKLGLKNISNGAYVSPATVIAYINQTSQLKLDFSIPEKYIGQLSAGDIVNFSYEGSTKSWKAKIIANESMVKENNRSLSIRALVIEKDKELMPGTFAVVKINFKADPNALLIPTQAVIPQARGKKVILFKNGKAVFTDIKTGPRDADNIQIIEGINEGDTVVTTGLLTVRPDAEIKIGKIVNQ